VGVGFKLAWKSACQARDSEPHLETRRGTRSSLDLPGLECLFDAFEVRDVELGPFQGPRWPCKPQTRAERDARMSNSLEIVDFTYCQTADLQLQLKVRITSLEGVTKESGARETLGDSYLRYASASSTEYVSSSCQTAQNGQYKEAFTSPRQLKELYVTCQLWADNKPLAPPTQTSHKSFTTRYIWNEWIQFPVKYRDLPRNSQIAFTIMEAYAPGKASVLGGTTFRLFGKTK